MNPWTLRRLVPLDAGAYRELRLRMLREHPSAFTSSFEEEAAKDLAWSRERLAAVPARPHDFFLGAFSSSPQEALVGMVGLSGRYRAKERHNATVVGMYVAPEAAGQGLGRALMRLLLEEAAGSPGLLQLDLTVTAGNDAAQGIYEACGFRVYGTLPEAIRVGDEYFAKVQMHLRLR